MKPIDYTNYTPATLAEQHFSRASEADATWKDRIVERAWGYLETIPLINRIVAFVDSYFPTKSSVYTHMSYLLNNRFDGIKSLDITLRKPDDFLKVDENQLDEITKLKDANGDPVIVVKGAIPFPAASHETLAYSTAFFKSGKYFCKKEVRVIAGEGASKSQTAGLHESSPLSVAQFQSEHLNEIGTIHKSNVLRNRSVEEDELDRLTTLVEISGSFPQQGGFPNEKHPFIRSGQIL